MDGPFLRRAPACYPARLGRWEGWTSISRSNCHWSQSIWSERYTPFASMTGSIGAWPLFTFHFLFIFPAIASLAGHRKHERARHRQRASFAALQCVSAEAQPGAQPDRVRRASFGARRRGRLARR